jgi:uncharacterized protein DUF4262
VVAVQNGRVPSTPPARLSDSDQRLRKSLLDQADQFGNAVVQVAGDENSAPHAFTVGAWRRFGVAEAVVVGLPPEMSQVLLSAYVDRAVDGVRFRPGTIYDGFFDGVPVAFETVHKGWYPEYLGSAFLLYARGDFPAVQIIVPTPQGHWPWQQDAPPGFAQWQRILTASGRPESWTPGVTGP